MSDSTMPPVPAGEHTIEDIRGMLPFSGVYIGYVDDVPVYVGESRDVTKRVTRSRLELADCDGIGIVACPPEHRRRLEAYFIGLLNPPRNSQSSERIDKGEHSRKPSRQLKDGYRCFWFPHMLENCRKGGHRIKPEFCEVLIRDGEVFVPSPWIAMGAMEATLCLSFDGLEIVAKGDVVFVPVTWAIAERRLDSAVVGMLEQAKKDVLAASEEEVAVYTPEGVRYWEPADE